MFRYMGPLILAGAACFVAYSNHDGDNAFLLLPYVDVLPWVGDTLQERGDATWQILGGMSAVYLLFSGWTDLRWRARRREDEVQMEEAEQLREWREATPWRSVEDPAEE